MIKFLCPQFLAIIENDTYGMPIPDRTVLGLTSGDIPVDGVKELEEVPHFEARSPTMEPLGQSSLASRGSGDSGPTALAM